MLLVLDKVHFIEVFFNFSYHQLAVCFIISGGKGPAWQTRQTRQPSYVAQWQKNILFVYGWLAHCWKWHIKPPFLATFILLYSNKFSSCFCKKHIQSVNTITQCLLDWKEGTRSRYCQICKDKTSTNAFSFLCGSTNVHSHAYFYNVLHINTQSKIVFCKRIATFGAHNNVLGV